jgi:hypothetical protein
MSKSAFFQCLVIFVLISTILACNLPFGTPESNGTAPTEFVTPESNGTVPTESVISLKLTLVTGSDGTADVYEFSVPHPFCQIIGFQMSKPSSSGIDDPWLPTSITIELAGKIVYFDGTLSDLGPVTASFAPSGNWSGTDIYKQQCGN